MDRLTRRFADAERALRTLNEALRVAAPTLLERDGIIQRFAYTFEAVRRTAHTRSWGRMPR